jgi:hypothetical protein
MWGLKTSSVMTDERMMMRSYTIQNEKHTHTVAFFVFRRWRRHQIAITTAATITAGAEATKRIRSWKLIMRNFRFALDLRPCVHRFSHHGRFGFPRRSGGNYSPGAWSNVNAECGAQVHTIRWFNVSPARVSPVWKTFCFIPPRRIRRATATATTTTTRASHWLIRLVFVCVCPVRVWTHGSSRFGEEGRVRVVVVLPSLVKKV